MAFDPNDQWARITIEESLLTTGWLDRLCLKPEGQPPIPIERRCAVAAFDG